MCSGVSQHGRSSSLPPSKLDHLTVRQLKQAYSRSLLACHQEHVMADAAALVKHAELAYA